MDTIDYRPGRGAYLNELAGKAYEIIFGQPNEVVSRVEILKPEDFFLRVDEVTGTGRPKNVIGTIGKDKDNGGLVIFLSDCGSAQDLEDVLGHEIGHVPPLRNGMMDEARAYSFENLWNYTIGSHGLGTDRDDVCGTQCAEITSRLMPELEKDSRRHRWAYKIAHYFDIGRPGRLFRLLQVMRREYGVGPFLAEECRLLNAAKKNIRDIEDRLPGVHYQ
ncbi:MAG: hypothetical protein KJ709_08255 [Nanoarchaeota archaeon]|nr:hypothetical protein [Nanoarchaeota archaeon]